MAGMITTFGDAVLEIGTTLSIPGGTDAAQAAVFETDVFTPIAGVGDVGEFGGEVNIVKYPTLGDKFVRKMTGTADAGDPAIEVGNIAGDPGQLKLKAAAETKYYYNFRLTLADAASADETPTVIYFRAIVAGRVRQFGDVEGVLTATYTLAIYPKPVEIPAHETP